MALTFGSLFAGIGGFDLGLERAGMECRWQVERDEWCRRVLVQHWPTVRQYGDVLDCGAHNLEAVHLIAGGFPCQPVSRNGKRLAQADERWLWPEFARIVRELRPRYVIVENVPGLLDGGLGDVLGDLAALGFDAEWSVLSACAVGAPHTRERVWIVAYPEGEHGPSWDRLDTSGARRPSPQPRGLHGVLVDTRRESASPWLGSEPLMGRMADGIPEQVERLTALGNAIVPQIAEWIGRRIIEAEMTSSESVGVEVIR